MALIDSDNFITHLVWSGLIDKANCGELKEAIELCTVKDVYTKADMVAILEEISLKFDEQYYINRHQLHDDSLNRGLEQGQDIIQQKINALKGEENGKIG